MVSINFTIVVQVALFLIFLWVTNKLVLRPMLRVMDKRAETNRENLQAAEQDAKEAEKLESDYASEIAASRRESILTIEKARREAMSERLQTVAARKQATDEEVAAVRDEAMGEVSAARGAYAKLAPALVNDIARRLKVEPGDQKGARS